MADMNDKQPVVTVHILDHEYQLACPPHAEPDLRNASHYLDMKMREIRNSGRVIGLERIAVMAALNITHELLEIKAGANVSSQANVSTPSRIETLQNKIDSVLEKETLADVPMAELD